MQDTPLVYVILSTYNSANTLYESIMSVLEQSYTNIKLVIVDDGSTDSTPSILTKVSEVDPRVHIIKKTNSGLGDSRNKAIEYSIHLGAEFLAFCDADDVWTPNKLLLQMQLFSERPDADIVVTDMMTYEAEIGEENKNKWRYTYLDNIFETLCLRNFTFQPVTAVVRSKLFHDIAKFETDKSGQDFYPFLRFAIEGHHFYKVEQPLYRERALEGSLQRSPRSAFLGGRARIRAVNRVYKEIADSSLMTEKNIYLLHSAQDRYCSWMLSGARKVMPYHEQFFLTMKQMSQFNNKKMALREMMKAILYPMYFSLKKRL